jgi:hypothetical protein
MNTTRRTLCVLFLGLFFLSACTRGEKPAGPSPRAPVPSDEAVPEGADTSLIVDSSADPSELLAAVVTFDGRLLPIALRNGEKRWSNPWTEPAYEGAAPPRPARLVPRKWLFYVADHRSRGLLVSLQSLVLGEAQCGRNWAFSTDLKVRSIESSDGPGRVVGLAFSSGVDRLSEEEEKGQVENFNTVREQFTSLVASRDANHATRFMMLGYFKLVGGVIGVGLSEGEASEKYEVFEVLPDHWKLLLEVDGGGCVE